MSLIPTCRACGKPVYWLHNDHTGKRAPIVADADPTGNCTIDLVHSTYHVLAKGEATTMERHINHFTDCPAAARFHKSGRA